MRASVGLAQALGRSACAALLSGAFVPVFVPVFVLGGCRAQGVDARVSSIQYPPPVRVATLRALRADETAAPTGSAGAESVRDLTQLLAAPDPELRDALAYTVLSRWIESGLEPATQRELVTTLRASLRGDVGTAGSAQVLARSFSALVLASVLRRDRTEHFLEESEHRALFEEALSFFEHETDARGYDPELGWVHATAHGTDLLRGVARSRYAIATEHERILVATERKVATFPRTFEAGEERRLAWTLAFLTEIPRERMAELAERLATTTKAFWARSEASARVDAAELAHIQNARRLVESLFLVLNATANVDEAVKDRVGRAALSM